MGTILGLYAHSLTESIFPWPVFLNRFLFCLLLHASNFTPLVTPPHGTTPKGATLWLSGDRSKDLTLASSTSTA